MRHFPVNVKKFCNSCGFNTLVIPVDNSKCSGCGKYYVVVAVSNDDTRNDAAVVDFSGIIISQGMLYTRYIWVPITCIIDVDRQTEKAVHGLVTVLEVGQEDPIYPPEIYWVPKSMCTKPWFICTVLNKEENKVANRRFDNGS